MKSGVSEINAINQYGERCGLHNYKSWQILLNKTYAEEQESYLLPLKMS